MPASYRICERRALTRGAASRALAADRIQRAARRPGALVRAHRARGCREPAWTRLLVRAAARSSRRCSGEPRWYVEAHQFRIDTARGIGRPTPEGAHRDGVDLSRSARRPRSASRAARRACSRRTAPHGVRFTLTEPWSALLLDDARVIHETTPIQPAGPERRLARHAGADLPRGGVPGAGVTPGAATAGSDTDSRIPSVGR